ncbi:hypothetical protein BJ508DRAFT_315606 [Ascobolus immersus RN42]|uniref:Uncharacterized protein n=1 Tax=Ascobolus immersus RN42 TaxID=1160509 RepID=A0A3N4HHB6_ASCIM|nr:hypothetical protein BJ508DRAFT_315606 [Ascobolus immersus RN42]
MGALSCSQGASEKWLKWVNFPDPGHGKLHNPPLRSTQTSPFGPQPMPAENFRLPRTLLTQWAFTPHLSSNPSIPKALATLPIKNERPGLRPWIRLAAKRMSLDLSVGFGIFRMRGCGTGGTTGRNNNRILQHRRATSQSTTQSAALFDARCPNDVTFCYEMVLTGRGGGGVEKQTACEAVTVEKTQVVSRNIKRRKEAKLNPRIILHPDNDSASLSVKHHAKNYNITDTNSALPWHGFFTDSYTTFDTVSHDWRDTTFRSLPPPVVAGGDTVDVLVSTCCGASAGRKLRTNHGGGNAKSITCVGRVPAGMRYGSVLLELFTGVERDDDLDADDAGFSPHQNNFNEPHEIQRWNSSTLTLTLALRRTFDGVAFCEVKRPESEEGPAAELDLAAYYTLQLHRSSAWL